MRGAHGNDGGSRRKPGTKKPPLPNTYWRGPPGAETLWARIELKGKPIRWSLRLRWPLRPGDLDLARGRIEARREQLVAAAHYGDARKHTEEALLSWAQHHILHQVAATTARRYAVSLKQLKPWLAGTFADEIGKATVRDIVDGRRAHGVTTATIRRDLVALGDFLDYCAEQEWRADEDYNPALTRLRKLKERRDPIVLPDPAHIDRVIAAAAPSLRPLIAGALKTGCRQEELVSARRNGLDHKLRQLTVIGKGNKQRVVPLSFPDLPAAPFADAYEALRAVPARLGCPWLYWHHDGLPYRAVAVHFNDLVRTVFAAAYDAFHGTTATTRPPLTALIKRQGDKDWRDIGFRTFTFHHLRHRFAVDYLKAGGSIYHLQQHLGHSSVSTTEIYLQFLTPEEKLVAKFGRGAGTSTESQLESQPQRSGAAERAATP